MSGLRRAFAGLLAAGLLAAPAAAAPPDAVTLLRRAEQLRNPVLGVAVDLRLSVVSRDSGRELRHSRYTLLTRRGGRTLLLMRPEGAGAPGAVLIAEDAYWLLLPRAERPVRLPLGSVVAGDLSHAGALRVDLWRRYEPREAERESVDGVACRLLELRPRGELAPFGRVRYWIAEEGALPVRIELYDAAGAWLKTARFTRYQETGAGPRPARIEIEDAGRPHERATLVLGEPQGVPTSRLTFDLDDLLALRATARRLAVESDGEVGGRRLVAALAAAARTRAARATGR